MLGQQQNTVVHFVPLRNQRLIRVMVSGDNGSEGERHTLVIMVNVLSVAAAPE